MKAQADKTQENKSPSVANKVSQKKNNNESVFQLEDNRPEAIAQRRLQEGINNSLRVKQLMAIQEMANNSPRRQHTLQLQAKMQAHTMQKFTQFMKPEEEEKEPLQGKFETIQRAANSDEDNDKTLQRKLKTGLPDKLKSGIENLSGHAMDDVKVHYNSDKPTQLNAHAYAQGTDIHLAPGQEKHLPHEAWHVVQQKQGRVKPTMQMKGKVNINDDKGLEKEADVMGEKALQMKLNDETAINPALQEAVQRNSQFPLQFKPVKDEKFNGFYKDSKEERLKLKLIKTDPSDVAHTGKEDNELDNKSAEFLLKDQLTPLFWKKEKIDVYYTQNDYSNEFDVDKYMQYHQFGSWLETFSEVRAEHEKIDKQKLGEQETERLKNVLSMYLFQQGVNNAFFSAKEIDRFAFQASPLIYRTENQYLRSFATSYVKALQQKLPKELKKGTFMPVRSADMKNALGQFFAVLDIKDTSEVGKIKSELENGIAKTIEKTVDFLYTDKAVLEDYWSVPGNPQAFIDLTETLKNKKIDYSDVSKIGEKVKTAFQQAVIEKLVDLNQKKDLEKPDNPEDLKKHLLNRIDPKKAKKEKTEQGKEQGYAENLKSELEKRINATHEKFSGQEQKYKKGDLGKVSVYLEQLETSKTDIGELKSLGVDGKDSTVLLEVLSAISDFGTKLNVLDKSTFENIQGQHPEKGIGFKDPEKIAINFRYSNSVADKLKPAEDLPEDLRKIQSKIRKIKPIPQKLKVLAEFKDKKLGNLDTKVGDVINTLGKGELKADSTMETGKFKQQWGDIFKIEDLEKLKTLLKDPAISSGSQKASGLLSFKPVAGMGEEKSMANIEKKVKSFDKIDPLTNIMSDEKLFKKLLEGKVKSLSISDLNQIFTSEVYQGLVSKSKDKYEKAFAKLLPKVLELIENSGYVLTTGRTLEEETETKKKTKVRGVQIDDSRMEMGVKAAINKTGNVPSPTEAIKKFFEIGTPIREITESILETQMAKMPKKDKEGKLSDETGSNQDYIGKIKTQISERDNDKSLFTDKKESALEAANKAFKKFSEFKNKEHTSIESDSVIKLINGSGALNKDRCKLPVFALKQLEQHLEDAIVSTDKMEEYATHIQFIHEIVILQLSLSKKDEILDKSGEKTDYEKFDFHVPKFDSGKLNADKDKFLQSVHLSDYGLKAFSQAYNAVAEQAIVNGRNKLNVDAFYNIYFELNDKFRATEKTSKEKVKLTSPTDVDEYLKSDSVKKIDEEAHRPDVILIDIHPNDATREIIQTNDVNKLIEKVFEVAESKNVKKYRLTVIVDITLNHTSDPRVGEIRKRSEKYISAGNLNLVFVQSLTKFSQLGIDKQSGGLIFAYNKGDDWEKFNDSLDKAKKADPTDESISRYFYALFEYAKDEQVQYIDRIRKNTQHLQERLTKSFEKLDIKDNAITIGTNTDKGTCYVSIRYDEFISSLQSDMNIMSHLALGIDKPKKGTRERNEKIEEQVGYEKMHQFNVDVLEKGILGLMQKVGLPVAYRMSFGFPLSNVGETGKEVRFTIGIEQEELLNNYADVLSYLNAKLAKEAESEKENLNDREKRMEFLEKLIKEVDDMEDLKKKLKGLEK